MSTDYRQADFNLEAKLAGMNLSRVEHEQILAAAHTAEKLVAGIEWISGALKRLIGTMALKPSVRA